MDSKSEILQNIRKSLRLRYEMPDWKIDYIEYADRQSQFVEACRNVGGNTIVLEDGVDISDLVREQYPTAQTIVSDRKDISIATFQLDTISDLQGDSKIDLAIIQGEYGIAENGAVWISSNTIARIAYFISEYLVILLDKNKLFNNMHEAYDVIDFRDKEYGVFISGPSKTADIEQELVIGAHGAKGVSVVLI